MQNTPHHTKPLTSKLTKSTSSFSTTTTTPTTTSQLPHRRPNVRNTNTTRATRTTSQRTQSNSRQTPPSTTPTNHTASINTQQHIVTSFSLSSTTQSPTYIASPSTTFKFSTAHCQLSSTQTSHTSSKRCKQQPKHSHSSLYQVLLSNLHQVLSTTDCNNTSIMQPFHQLPGQFGSESRKIKPLSHYSNHLFSLQQQQQRQQQQQPVFDLQQQPTTLKALPRRTHAIHSTTPLRSSSSTRHNDTSGDHPTSSRRNSSSDAPIMTTTSLSSSLADGDDVEGDDDDDESNITLNAFGFNNNNNPTKFKPKRRKKVIIITGGTAVGKTSLSIELAKKLNGEIISADSMQIYSHFDTGTAKIGLDETEGIPHHLVDIVPSGGTDFSSSMFYQSATEIINNIVARKKTPILVGGTGLYLRWLLYGRPQGMNITPDQSSRTVCINHYMATLTKGLLGWEKSVGAGKGVGKTQQVTHTENLYKFLPPGQIPLGLDLIGAKAQELNQILQLYPAAWYKDHYSRDDILNEITNDELQHLCISNQIRWAKVPSDDITVSTTSQQRNHTKSQRFVKVSGVKQNGLENTDAFLPEFQSLPFLDTLYELYNSYTDPNHPNHISSNNDQNTNQDELNNALMIIRGLFLEPTVTQFSTPSNDSNDPSSTKTPTGNGYTVFQNDHPFPTNYQQNHQLINNAEFSFHLYRLYTTLHFRAYGNNVSNAIRNLFINDESKNSQREMKGDEDDLENQFAFLYDQPEITAETIGDRYVTQDKPIPYIEHNGEFFTPRLLQYHSLKDNNRNDCNNDPILSLTTEMMEILHEFKQIKIPQKLVSDYITLVLTHLDRQYQQIANYRRFLHRAQRDWVGKEIARGRGINDLINGVEPDHNHYEGKVIDQNELDQEECYRNQLTQNLLLHERDGDDDHLNGNDSNEINSDSNESPDKKNNPSTTQQQLAQPLSPVQSRQDIHSRLSRLAMTDHIAPLQEEKNLFRLTMTSIHHQREKVLQDAAEYTQTIEYSLEDPFQLRQKYSQYADYRHLASTTTAATQPVDSLLGMFYFGYDDPHSLSPISSPSQLDQTVGKSQLEQYSRQNKSMIQQGINHIRSGAAKRLQNKAAVTLTANTIFTIVPESSITSLDDDTVNGDINLPPSSNLAHGLYKCPNDIYIKVQSHKPTPTLKNPPQTAIHPFNSLIFQSKLLFSKFKLPVITWVESHRYNNDLYRLEKSLCHVLATDGVAIPPKYKDQMNTQALERLAGRVPWDDDDEEGLDDITSNENSTGKKPRNNNTRALYNSSTANAEGLINHFDVRCYFLHTHRNLHYRLADFRCEQMVRGGMLKETLLLLNTYNDSKAKIPYPIPDSDSNTGTATMKNPNDGGIRGLWPTSPNFDYFMRNDLDGYLKRYFPHPQQSEAKLMLTDTTTTNRGEMTIDNNNNNNNNVVVDASSSSSPTNKTTAKDQQQLHQQQLTSEWLYLDELMFTYRQVALPVMSQLFDTTHALIQQGLNNSTDGLIYHNQYKNQYLDPNAKLTSSSDIYNSNALATLTYSIFERSLAYLGYLMEFPEKANEMFKHCGFTNDDLDQLSSLLTHSISHTTVSNQLDEMGRVTSLTIGSGGKKKVNSIVDPRTALIAIAVNCMQIERQMVIYAPIKDSATDDNHNNIREYKEEIDSTQLRNLLSPTLDKIFGQNHPLLPKVIKLLHTAGISSDYSIRSDLLEYDFSITDSYKSQRGSQEVVISTSSHDPDNTILQTPSFSQHLYNYEIINDNTSPLYRFVTGRSGKDFVNTITERDEGDERLVDTIIKSNKQTTLTILPCEHLITLPKIRLIQQTLPDTPYLVNPEATQEEEVDKPVNINPLANTVVSLFSPRVKSIGYTNILGFFTDSAISSLFTQWNGLMTQKERERDLKYFLSLKQHLDDDQKVKVSVVEEQTLINISPEISGDDNSNNIPMVDAEISNDQKDHGEDQLLTKQPEVIKKVKIPAVMTLTVDGELPHDSLAINNSMDNQTGVQLWSPKVFVSTSKDKSHHFLPTIGLSADITTPNLNPDQNALLSSTSHPAPQQQQQEQQQQQQQKKGNQQKQKQNNQKVGQQQKEAVSSRLPWNTDLKRKEELLGSLYPVNTSFVDGLHQLQQNHYKVTSTTQHELDTLIQQANAIGLALPPKPSVQVSIAELRAVIPPQFISQFTSLINDFQTSTRGYIKRQHTFFQDEPICQLVTIPFENIPLFMNSNDHSTFKGYQDAVQSYLKQIGSNYDQLLANQYNQMKEKFHQDEEVKRLEAQEVNPQPETSVISSGSSSSSSSSSTSSSKSSNSSSTSSTTSSSYPFSFPRSVNFNLLPREKFAVKDVQFNQVHVGAYYKEFMYQYIPQHVKQSISNLQHAAQEDGNDNNNPYQDDHPSFLFGPAQHNFTPISNQSNTVVVTPPDNHSKHPLRRAMPVVYDFSNTQHTLITPLSPTIAPLLTNNNDKQSTKKNTSSLGLYKSNLGRVIEEITADITQKDQVEYWEGMLQRHERKQRNLPPLKSYPYTTLSTLPPLMDSCVDLTSYQGSLQLYWNDGVVLETVMDLFEFQRGLSILKQISSNQPTSMLSDNAQDTKQPFMPLDVEVFNYFSHHKTVLKQDIMSTRLFDHDTKTFFTDGSSDHTAQLSLSSPINNSQKAVASSSTNVQSVRQYGITSNTNEASLSASAPRTGRRIEYPWQNFIQLDNNELLGTKHSY